MSSPYNNLNKIDSVLKESFGSENVNFDQKERRLKNGSTHDYVFTIQLNSMEVKMLVEGSSSSSDIKWSYYEDPTNENSKLISRNDIGIESINEKLNEIFENKMFSKKYLDTVYESINESNSDEDGMKDIFITSDEMKNNEPIIEVYEENLKMLFDEFGLVIEDIQISDDTILINLDSKTYDGEITTATRVSVESKFNNFEVVDLAWFSGNKFSVSMNGKPELHFSL